ncbi:MAG: hypothetical protein H6700_11195 [Myxococcales bacterium]|nr:hypothetical protein [Myxococcales bacterium]
MRHYLADMGRRIVLVDFEDDAALQAALDANAGDVAVVYGETLSNPLVRRSDIPRRGAGRRGRRHVHRRQRSPTAVFRSSGAHLVVEPVEVDRGAQRRAQGARRR